MALHTLISKYTPRWLEVKVAVEIGVEIAVKIVVKPEGG